MVDSDFLNETSIASWLTCHLSCHSPSRCARRRVSQTMLPIARPRQGPLALAHLARKPFPSSVPSHRPRLRPPPGFQRGGSVWIQMTFIKPTQN